MNTLTKVKIS